jgi:phosphoglycerol geranylgeranyltransferase
MRIQNIYNNILQTHKIQGSCGFAVLIDPDNVTQDSIISIAQKCNDAAVDIILLGGSLMVSNHIKMLIQAIKSVSNIPVVLFPGHPSQVEISADGLLFLSLISGRNAELLIGQHVIAAPTIKQSPLEVIPTGYMVVDGGRPTTVSYISNAAPIPRDKADIALCTAWAGELLGLKAIYMDAGSGAAYPISAEMIHKVSKNIAIPLIVGGGMRTAAEVKSAVEAGAQMVVVGNAIEQQPALITEIASVIQNFNSQLFDKR